MVLRTSAENSGMKGIKGEGGGFCYLGTMGRKMKQ